MRRVSAALCFALVALGGCVTPSTPAGPRRSLPLAHEGQVVVVTSGETRFSVIHEGNEQVDPTLDDVLRWPVRCALTSGRPAGAADYEQSVAVCVLQADEASFIEAAVARLIPADDTGPGALEADVPVYIDRQLAGAWGAGAGLYRTGPWQSGTPEQGYQLPLCPERPRLRPRALCLLPPERVADPERR